MDNKISELSIVRYLSNECSIDEKENFEKKMESDSQIKAMVERLSIAWKMERKKFSVKDIDSKWFKLKAMVEADLNNSHQKDGDRIRSFGKISRVWPSNYSVLMKYAAVFITIVISAFLLLSQKPIIEKESSIEYLSVKVQTGKRTTISLSDGTKVTLDACSELKFPSVFGETRDVYLEGEGYFEVAKDSDRPFRVHAKSALVNVVGTKFNVRSWKENPIVTVTVLEGKVILSNENAKNSPGIYLGKGKQCSVSKMGKVLKPIDVNPEEYIKWMNNEIYFKNAILKEIIAQLERWYGYTFIFDNNDNVNQILTVYIRRANVDEVINVISQITKTEIIRNGKIIRFIKKNKIAA